MSDRIVVPIRRNRTDLFGDAEGSYEPVCVDYEPQAHRARESIRSFFKQRGQRPGFLILGWRSWIRLGWEIGGRSRLVALKEFEGVPVVVDEVYADVVRVSPTADGVRSIRPLVTAG